MPPQTFGTPPYIPPARHPDHILAVTTLGGLAAAITVCLVAIQLGVWGSAKHTLLGDLIVLSPAPWHLGESPSVRGVVVYSAQTATLAEVKSPGQSEFLSAAAVSPARGALAVVMSRLSEGKGSRVVNQLKVVSLNDATDQTLSESATAAFVAPMWSGDASTLAYLHVTPPTVKDGKPTLRMMRQSVAGGEASDLGAGYPLALSMTGATLLYLDEGRHLAFRSPAGVKVLTTTVPYASAQAVVSADRQYVVLLGDTGTLFAHIDWKNGEVTVMKTLSDTFATGAFNHTNEVLLARTDGSANAYSFTGVAVESLSRYRLPQLGVDKQLLDWLAP